MEFEVETNGLPDGTYHLYMGMRDRGEFSVENGYGAMRFSSPAEDGRLLLNFDPREMSLEIRDLSEAVIDSMYRQIEQEAEVISAQAGVGIAFRPIPFDAVPAPTDERVRRLIGDAAERLGLSSREMPSGAGHDAQDIARIAPIGMIFVPSVGGVSHSPKEFTQPADMANGANVLLQTLLSIDAGWPAQ